VARNPSPWQARSGGAGRGRRGHQQFADEIGADGYSEDAIGAVAVAKKLMGV
jgi:methanogenic corrinoid protein MtbC1